jgi:hypothetical protein
MKAFRVMTLLLALCLGAAPAAAAALPRDPAGERLTPGEEIEARELARLFVERFRETNDIAPLVEELFVEDFAERLRHDADGAPMCFLRREVALRAAPAELREFYVAEFNFFVLTLEHWMSRPEGPGGDGEGEPTLEQMYPREVAEVLRSEPLFAAYITGDKPAPEEPGAAESGEAKPDGAKGEGDDDDRFVTSLTMLRELTSLTGKAVGALRPHVPPFALMIEARRETIGDEHLCEIDAPYAETREDSFYGFPAGTRFIRLDVEPLHDLQLQLYAVRVEDGRLRILAAFPVLGD